MVSNRPLKLLRPNFLCIGNGDHVVCFDPKTCEFIGSVDTSQVCGLGKNISFLSSWNKEAMLVCSPDTLNMYTVGDDGRWRFQSSKPFSERVSSLSWIAPQLVAVGGWNRLRLVRYDHGRFSDVSQETVHEGNVVGISALAVDRDGSLHFATAGQDCVLKKWILMPPNASPALSSMSSSSAARKTSFSSSPKYAGAPLNAGDSLDALFGK